MNNLSVDGEDVDKIRNIDASHFCGMPTFAQNSFVTIYEGIENKCNAKSFTRKTINDIQKPCGDIHTSVFSTSRIQSFTISTLRIYLFVV